MRGFEFKTKLNRYYYDDTDKIRLLEVINSLDIGTVKRFMKLKFLTFALAMKKKFKY